MGGFRHQWNPYDAPTLFFLSLAFFPLRPRRLHNLYQEEVAWPSQTQGLARGPGCIQSRCLPLSLNEDCGPRIWGFFWSGLARVVFLPPTPHATPTLPSVVAMRREKEKRESWREPQRERERGRERQKQFQMLGFRATITGPPVWITYWKAGQVPKD